MNVKNKAILDIPAAPSSSAIAKIYGTPMSRMLCYTSDKMRCENKISFTETFTTSIDRLAGVVLFFNCRLSIVAQNLCHAPATNLFSFIYEFNRSDRIKNCTPFFLSFQRSTFIQILFSSSSSYSFFFFYFSGFFGWCFVVALYVLVLATQCDSAEIWAEHKTKHQHPNGIG